MKHVSTFSLGGGSWLTARIVEREIVSPGDEHRLVFTDTLYEDADAYRFGIEAALNVFDRRANWIPQAEDFPDYRVAEDVSVADYAGNPEWRAFLAQLRARTAEAVPELIWLVEGRDPWEIWRDERFLGNSSKDPCAKIAKRQVLERWLKAECDPAETAIYFGIGDGEKHRYEDFDKKTGKPLGIKHRYADKGWNAQAPLIGRIEGNLRSTVYMSYQRIRPPRLYAWADHNNCGGGCCKSGQKHRAAQREHMPERFAYDAMMERKFREWLGADVTFLTDRRGGTGKKPLSLDAFAARLDAEPQTQIPEPEPGENGCGCMTEEAA